MLKLHNIRAGYQKTLILEDICLEIGCASFTGIIGPNGSGKTTLLKLITGVKAPQKGSILFNSRPLSGIPRKQLARQMAVVPQSSFVPPLFTVEEVVSMGRYPFQGLRLSDSAADRRAVRTAMEKTELSAIGSKPMQALSGGQRQEVLIARALAQTPELLILDEPTANLDIKHQMKIMALTRSLVDTGDLTAVMVIHDLGLAARFCDGLVLIHDRKILARGLPQKVLTPAHLKTAYGVDAVIGKNHLTGALDVTVLNVSELGCEREAV